MKQLIAAVSTVGLVLFSSVVVADHSHHRGGLHACLKAASAIKDGWYVKLEYLTLTDQGVRTYEIELEDENGDRWEFMCNVSRGTIYEMEREVTSASDPLFKKQMKVDEETAGKTALEVYPGRIAHTEYEIETNGDAVYEFDIATHKGATFKVEVDAATGKITEVSIEKWDIGREKD